MVTMVCLAFRAINTLAVVRSDESEQASDKHPQRVQTWYVLKKKRSKQTAVFQGFTFTIIVCMVDCVVFHAVVALLQEQKLPLPQWLSTVSKSLQHPCSLRAAALTRSR